VFTPIHIGARGDQPTSRDCPCGSP
jgi:hypothetical protein